MEKAYEIAMLVARTKDQEFQLGVRQAYLGKLRSYRSHTTDSFEEGASLFQILREKIRKGIDPKPWINKWYPEA